MEGESKSLNEQLARLEEKYAVSQSDGGAPGELMPSHRLDWPQGKEPEYDGPLTVAEVSLRGREDAVNDGLGIRTDYFTYPKSLHEPRQLILDFPDGITSSSLDHQMREVFNDRWDDMLWDAYLRSYGTQMRASDFSFSFESVPREEDRTPPLVTEDWHTLPQMEYRAYVIDRRRWEYRRTKDRTEAEWRLRSMWARVRALRSAND